MPDPSDDDFIDDFQNEERKEIEAWENAPTADDLPDYFQRSFRDHLLRQMAPGDFNPDNPNELRAVDLEDPIAALELARKILAAAFDHYSDLAGLMQPNGIPLPEARKISPMDHFWEAASRLEDGSFYLTDPGDHG